MTVALYVFAALGAVWTAVLLLAGLCMWSACRRERRDEERAESIGY